MSENQHLMYAMEEVLYAWYQYRSATTPVTQADYLVILNNKMYDLSTYHPRFDDRTGELKWDGDE